MTNNPNNPNSPLSERDEIAEAKKTLAMGCTLNRGESEAVLAALDEAGRGRQAWEDTAAQYARNQEYYCSLLDEIGVDLGVEAFTADDGGVHDSVLRAKVPELVRNLQSALSTLQAELEALKKPVSDWEKDMRSLGLMVGVTDQETTSEVISDEISSRLDDLTSMRKERDSERENALQDAIKAVIDYQNALAFCGNVGGNTLLALTEATNRVRALQAIRSDRPKG